MSIQQSSKSTSSIIRSVIIVVVFTLLGGGGMFALAKHRQHTYYEAKRSMVISHDIHNQNGTSDPNNTLNSPDLSMMPTYRKIVENPTIARTARHYLPKKLRKKYSTNDISKMIDTHISDQSLVLDLTVDAGDKGSAVKIANAVSRAFKEELPSIQPGTVRLLAPASKSDVLSVTTPHAKKYVVVGLAFGCLLGLIIDFVYVTWTKLL